MRDRVPYSLVLFAVVLMAAAFLMSRLTAGQDLKVIKDLGLATMNAIGLLIAIFIGTGLVPRKWSGAASTPCSPSRCRGPASSSASTSASCSRWRSTSA